MSTTVIVTGPQGCGKTRMSRAIAAHFGLSKVVDGWDGESEPPRDVLLLTSVPAAALNAYGCRVVEFDALRAPLLDDIEEMGRLMKAREGKEKSFLHAVPAADADLEELARGLASGSKGELADRAAKLLNSVQVAGDEHGFDPLVEARLTEEVLRLARSLAEFAGRFKAVREAAAGSQLGELIPLFFELCCAQVAYGLLKDGDPRGLLAEFAEKLACDGLEIQQAFRVVELEGREFLCVSFPKGGQGKVFDRNDGGEQV